MRFQILANAHLLGIVPGKERVPHGRLETNKLFKQLHHYRVIATTFGASSAPPVKEAAACLFGRITHMVHVGAVRLVRHLI